MRLSDLLAMLSADLEAHGDTENVTIGLVVPGAAGKKHRLDSVVATSNDISVFRDSNFTNGMTCIVAECSESHTDMTIPDLIKTATDAVFSAGKTLPRNAYQGFLVCVIHSATWCLRQVSGDDEARTTLDSAMQSLETPVANYRPTKH